METQWVKQSGILIPANDETIDWLSKKKLGQVFRAEFKAMRNYLFHKKFFSLLNYAFDHWEPGEINTKYGKPEKNFETFREYVTIKAGYFYLAFNPDGGFKVKAKSISFASMENDEFEKLYSAAIDVILKRILTNYTREDLDEVVMRVINYV